MQVTAESRRQTARDCSCNASNSRPAFGTPSLGRHRMKPGPKACSGKEFSWLPACTQRADAVQNLGMCRLTWFLEQPNIMTSNLMRQWSFKHARARQASVLVGCRLVYLQTVVCSRGVHSLDTSRAEPGAGLVLSSMIGSYKNIKYREDLAL